jgi:hypothetical protein
MSLRKLKKMMLGTEKIKSSQVRKKVNKGLRERKIQMSPIVRRIYIAASFPRKQEAENLARLLERDDTQIVSEWHEKDKAYADNDELMRQRAIRDCKQVLMSNIFICFTGDTMTHGGRHQEFGIALSKVNVVVIIGPRESVLHYHPRVLQYNTLDEFKVKAKI